MVRTGLRGSHFGRLKRRSGVCSASLPARIGRETPLASGIRDAQAKAYVPQARYIERRQLRVGPRTERVPRDVLDAMRPVPGRHLEPSRAETRVFDA